MYRRVMAFDYDGTLAINGDVPPEMETALEQCRASGHVLFLVTGRRYETDSLGHLAELFSSIVWENGAVLSHTASGETYLPFGQLDPRLLKAIEEAGIPFERGLEILKQYPLGGKFLDIPLKRERPILQGQTDSGTSIHIPAAQLAGLNLGVFGNSATGKSWMVGLLAEGLHHEDYQVLPIDPEGGFRGLRVLPRFVSMSGDRLTLPPPPWSRSSRKAGSRWFWI